MAYDMVPLFDEVLKMNKIKVPKSKLGKFVYGVEWSIPRQMYKRLTEAYESIRLKWWSYKVAFEAQGWRCDFPEFKEIVFFKFEELKFANPMEARKVMKAALDELDCVAISRLETKRQDAISLARRNWLRRIATDAGPKAMITLRRTDFNPTVEAKTIFERERQYHHEHAIITDNGFRVKMICFSASRFATIDSFRLEEFTPSNTMVTIK